MDDGYSFRPAVDQDIPMLSAWLRTPEAARWWGDPDQQAVLLRADLLESRMAMEIVSFDRRPFA